jgi:hypothetical protein
MGRRSLFWFRLWASFSLAVVLSSTAHADKRVALVIGNGLYQNVPALPNPPNDAADVAGSLRRLGFSVRPVMNASFDDMRRALLDFGHQASDAEMAVVFFAGHGMEIGGENWLIPVDAELRTDTDAETEAVSLRTVILQVSKASQLGLVILDGCRNNPFAAKMQRSIRVRAVERGLARIEPAENVLVAYAAKDGTTAADGDGRHSPFTTALLKNLEMPGLEITFMFRSVRDDVMAATHREQQPFVYGSLSKAAIYLKPSAPGIVTTAPEETIAPSSSQQQDKAQAAATPPSAGPDPSRQQRSPVPGRPSTGGVAAEIVDAAAVGSWELALYGKRGTAHWFWDIGSDGAYRFHSEGRPVAPPHSGAVDFNGGRWTLHATTGLPGYEDGGTYEFHGSDTFLVTGRLGTGVWRRVGSTESGELSIGDGISRVDRSPRR